MGAGVVVLVALCWTEGAMADPETHDGFQFRGTLGAGYLHDSESVDDPGGNELAAGSVSGAAASFELFFGGTPLPGLVFGGFLSGMAAPGPSVKMNGVTFDSGSGTSLGLGSVGPYVDFYPNPQSGFHVLGNLGYAQVTFNDGNGTVDEATSSGFILGTGVGYDAFVSDEWGLGVLGRLSYAWTGHESVGLKVHDNVLALGVSFSVTYH